MNLELWIKKISKTFPWYAQLLRENQAEVNQLESLPLMTEELLTQHYYHAEHAFPDRYHSYQTSGTTTGKRKRIIYSDNDQRIYLQQRMGIIKDFCGEGNIRACADLGTGHAAATAGEIFQSMGCEVELIDFTRPIEQHIEVLNRFKPDIFFTMPMILDCLIATGKLDFRPKKIIVLGDVATLVWQKKVADYFHIEPTQVLDLLGSIEIGSIALYNHSQGYYQFDPYLIPEVVPVQQIYPNADYRGTGGILLLTSFAREYFPAIRFVTNDLVEGFEKKIVQGKTLYTYQRCLGRFASEFKHGEKINLSDINDAMAKHLPYHRYDLDDRDGGLVIRIAIPSLPAEVSDAIKRDLLSRNPDIAQMIASGLVGDIRIQRIDEHKITSNIGKRRY
ncbi:fumarate--(S)-2,3-diaminopropanoate ligase [Xenorhabdus kozodoii]|uniref:Fumarate---2,3-diaminopropanoate ligase n=1 Tax=Xenorhabdus kozodoii TaxID=351676 RepID=A0A2D0LF49_9GAMM|nr:fumarate--(S)-2,3-diaminopropanoate ligase [Xenorhabdus kozodoii]PHM74235.1 Fumarate---2,3-diaminopropanoate ligase [Xenorhabdus kozodoii]